MKRIWIRVLSIFSILIGVGFLVFVLRMAWFPPSSMGMMMGRELMLHHIFIMFIRIIFFMIIIMGIWGIYWIKK